MQTLLDNKELAKLATHRAERQHPLDAELIPDIQAQWFVALTAPSHEAIAAAHLSAHRFGVYLPQYPVVHIIRGRQRRTMRNLFPGYLFVFVWGIERHYGRIVASTGVTGILSADGRAVVVSDRDMRQIQVEENRLCPMTFIDEVVKIRKRRKKRTQVLVQQETVISKGEIISVHAKSYWSGISELAEGERISKLHRALGLVS